MVKILLSLFSVLPLRVNHWLGYIIGTILYRTDSKSKHVVTQNIKHCFADLNHGERERLIKKALIETGKGLTESGFIWFNSFKNNKKYIHKTLGLEHLESDEPIILLVPHFGCWEITGRVLSLTKPLTFLYKPLRDDTQEKCLVSKRQQGDLSMATADKKGVMKLQRTLSQNGVIGILPDQVPDDDSSVVAPFFNQDARTMTLLVKLARRNKAKVLLTWAKRLEHAKGFELHLKPVNILSDSGDLLEDVRLMNQAIEDLVKTQPEQYLWNYKRFKTLIGYTD